MKGKYSMKKSDVIFNLKDCWLASLIFVTEYLKIDTNLLFINNLFKYKKVKKCADIDFNDIIAGNLNLSIDQSNIDEVSYIENIFLKKIIGLNGSYYDRSFEKDCFDLCIRDKSKIHIIMLDTFNCFWNPMFKKRHVLHCVVIYKVINDICFCYDSLRAENAYFTASFDEIKDAYIFFFTYDREKNIEFDYNSAFYLYMNEIVKNLNVREVVLTNLKCFYDDLEKCEIEIYNRTELQDKDTMALMIRLFEVQYEKNILQINILNKINIVPENLIRELENIGELWKLSSYRFSRVCFLPTEKKQENYSKVLVYMKDLIHKTDEFYINLNKII